MFELHGGGTARRSSIGLVLLAAVGLALAVGSAALTLATGGPERRVFTAIAGGITVLTLFGVAVFALRRDSRSRFGRLLIVAGCGWFLTTFSASDTGVLYSLGRVANWLTEPLLIYLFLSYPSGRLTRRSERIVVRLAVGVVLTLFLPTTFLVEHYPTPSPWVTCGDQCPTNAFAVGGSDAGFVDAVLRPIRDTIAVGLYVATVVLLVTRMRRGTQHLRRALVPVLGAAGLRFSATVAYLIARRAGADDAALAPFGSLVLLTVPIAAIGFLVGLLSWRLYSARVLERMIAGLREPTDPARLRQQMADALEDPSLELYYSGPGGRGCWRDADGRPVDLGAERGAGRCVVDIADGSESGAAIVCDGALRDQQQLVESVGSWVLAALERQRLATALKASLQDIEASRQRLATAAAGERHRIERNLHDGAQQQLVTLRVKLELASEAIARDPAIGREALDEIGSDVGEIIEHVRSLASGIYPPLLADAGLEEALRAAALRASVPVSVGARGLGRYPLEVESAVYFCCLEALQNAAKHAPGATVVSVEIADDGELRFEVRDDGPGFSPDGSKDGAGLTNMRDRLAALGGTLTIESSLGAGTIIRGEVPTHLPSSAG